MYIETSNATNNAIARLNSPSLKIQPGHTSCFSFWYSMYGANVNKLNIYFKNSTGAGSLVWTLSGTQGPNWHSVQLIVPSGTLQVGTCTNIYVIKCFSEFHVNNCAVFVNFIQYKLPGLFYRSLWKV